MIEELQVFYLFENASPQTLQDQLESLRERFHGEGMSSDPSDGTTDTLGVTEGEISGRLLVRESATHGLDAFTSRLVPDYPHLRLDISEEEQFRWPLDHDEYHGGMSDAYDTRVSDLLDLVTGIYTALDPTPSVAYGYDKGDLNTIIDHDEVNKSITESGLEQRQFEYVPWVAIMPPTFVERYGREHVLETSAPVVEELTDGSILLVSFRDILTMSDARSEAINAHLGMKNPITDDWLP